MCPLSPQYVRHYGPDDALVALTQVVDVCPLGLYVSHVYAPLCWITYPTPYTSQTVVNNPKTCGA